jgi:two-component system, NarL family, sensor kinase
MVTTGRDMDRIRRLHQLRSFRIAAVLRLGVVALMIAALLVGTVRAEWPQQTALLALYAFLTTWALLLAFYSVRLSGLVQQLAFVFSVVDVAALTGFQLLTRGGYAPLLVMALLPILLGLDASWRRAALVLIISAMAFAVAVLRHPLIEQQLGWPETLFLFGMYVFLCCTAFVAVRVEQRHADTVAGLSAVREQLLTETMTAAETERRRVSESIHDGPLQDVLVARQELEELADSARDEHVERALASLHDASTRLREATFELHPAVLEQVGLAAAVEQLASFTARRTGIAIATDIDYPARNSIDPIVFGVARELLSNVARHSRASRASVKLGIDDHKCCLAVADNGIGIEGDAAARRLGQGHIGLASQKARVEASGGRLTIVDQPVGTHIHIELPLRREAGKPP